MNPAGDRFSPNPYSSNRDYKLTIIDSRPLLLRLSSELLRLTDDIRRAWPEFRRNPVSAGHRSLARSLKAVRLWASQPGHVFGLVCAVFVVGSLTGLVIALDRNVVVDVAVEDLEEFSPADAVMLDLNKTNELTTGGYDRTARGRVGLRHDKGEGSAAIQARAQGGGSGGMRHPTPEQRGKVPPPSLVPAPIPMHAPKAPALPVAGIDIDPLLWTDIKYPAYGAPNSRAITPSNGPGDGGGMGLNEGLGIGNGRGNGYGSGSNGNTGGGERQIGSGGSGGGPPGGMGGSERILRTNEVEQKVRLLAKPEPHYSEEARRNQISGTVILRVVFTSAGEVSQIRAVNTLPFGLTERAIAAARQIRFLPAMKGGHPVSVYMQLEYNFNLY